MQDRFRFRYSYNNHIYNVLGIDFDFSRAVLHSLIGSETLMCKINLDNLMPCTGKRDRNGILIYEGDRVYIDCEDETAIIEWSDDLARFAIHFEDESALADFDDYYSEELEVIGNIYENSELPKE